MEVIFSSCCLLAIFFIWEKEPGENGKYVIYLPGVVFLTCPFRHLSFYGLNLIDGTDRFKKQRAAHERVLKFISFCAYRVLCLEHFCNKFADDPRKKVCIICLPSTWLCFLFVRDVFFLFTLVLTLHSQQDFRFIRSLSLKWLFKGVTCFILETSINSLWTLESWESADALLNTRTNLSP